jgi:two-component system response regulator HydG/two-component system response regulator AtoC
MLHVKEIIRRIAPVDSTVLITGETGTGKELAARALHNMSRRRTKPYVCVNCAAIPEGLLESELFGHEKGAFTGAIAKQSGKLRAAHEGTIFLDEIGEMAPSAQSKLLRALDAREVQPLGSNERIPIDVRVIAATNQDLERLMSVQKFRPDLFFRLSVLPVNMPALREHVDDIPDLVSRFIGELNAKYSRTVNGVTDEGIQLLLGYSWPGNVRQLRSVVERGYLICGSSWITADDLQWFPHKFAESAAGGDAYDSHAEFSYVLSSAEPDRLLEALKATRWNKSQAAKRLHWSRMTLYRKIAKYRLSPAGGEAQQVGGDAQEDTDRAQGQAAGRQ